jgi:hypothetical protein
MAVKYVFQMVIKYDNIFPPNFTPIGIFGFNINHLATLWYSKIEAKPRFAGF